MKKKNISYMTIAYTNAILWIALGFLTIGSIARGTDGLVVNLLMGLGFCMAGTVFFFKAKYAQRLHHTLRDHLPPLKSNELSKYWKLDTVITIFITLFVAILLLGTIHRVFMERYPVFG